jgi:hypothetical protein
LFRGREAQFGFGVERRRLASWKVGLEEIMDLALRVALGFPGLLLGFGVYRRERREEKKKKEGKEEEERKKGLSGFAILRELALMKRQSFLSFLFSFSFLFSSFFSTHRNPKTD